VVATDVAFLTVALAEESATPATDLASPKKRRLAQLSGAVMLSSGKKEKAGREGTQGATEQPRRGRLNREAAK
jgi:hypothetical protein